MGTNFLSYSFIVFSKCILIATFIKKTMTICHNCGALGLRSQGAIFDLVVVVVFE